MQDIDLTVTVDQPMPDAQDQILDRVDHRLRGAGYTSTSPRRVEYRPKFVGLVFVWLIRRLQHDGVTFTFDARGAPPRSRRRPAARPRPHRAHRGLGGTRLV